MKKIHTHLFLAHGNVISNIALFQDHNVCPKEVYLLVGRNDVQEIDLFTQLLKEKDINFYTLELSNPKNIDEVKECVSEFITRPEENNDIALNATGGTIPMICGAYEIFTTAGMPIYYFPEGQDDVVWLNRDWQSYDLADTLKLPDYFATYRVKHVKLKKSHIPYDLCKLPKTIILDIEKYSSAISYLNYLATEASSNNLLSPPIDINHYRNTDFNKLIDGFKLQHFLKVTKDKEILFSSEDARTYANGVWLEEHVYSVLHDLRGKLKIIQDLARNVELKWDRADDPFKDKELNLGAEDDLHKNELDVSFLADNRLYIIECKTVNFNSSKYNTENKASEILNKMKALKDSLGKENTRAMLISYHELPKSERNRAKHYEIDFCSYKEIYNLEEIFKRWIEKG